MEKNKSIKRIRVIKLIKVAINNLYSWIKVKKYGELDE
jgi:hypothetical protein